MGAGLSETGHCEIRTRKSLRTNSSLEKKSAMEVNGNPARQGFARKNQIFFFLGRG
jgi:hypothetical protein